MQVSPESILEMPNAFLLIDKVQSRLQDEQKRRRHFYEIVEENKKMEFINGEIIFHSPVRLQHNRATKLLCKLLDTFVAKHNLGFVGIEKIMISLTRNDYEPNVCFFGNDKAKDFKGKQVQFPAPDFVVEVYPIRPRKPTARRSFRITPRTASENIGLLTRKAKQSNSIFCRTSVTNF